MTQGACYNGSVMSRARAILMQQAPGPTCAASITCNLLSDQAVCLIHTLHPHRHLPGEAIDCRSAAATVRKIPARVRSTTAGKCRMPVHSTAGCATKPGLLLVQIKEPAHNTVAVRGPHTAEQRRTSTDSSSRTQKKMISLAGRGPACATAPQAAQGTSMLSFCSNNIH